MYLMCKFIKNHIKIHKENILTQDFKRNSYKYFIKISIGFNVVSWEGEYFNKYHNSFCTGI